MDREEAYRIYVTDALYCLQNRKAMQNRFVDFIKDDASQAHEETGEETIARITAKLRGEPDGSI